MTYYILDKCYVASTPVEACRAVVRANGTNAVKLPAGGNAGAIAGVTVFTQTIAGRGVSVRKAGIANVVAAAAVAIGDPVNIADAQGRVKALNEAAGTKVECLGFAETAAAAAGDIIEVFICPHQRIA